MPKSQPSSLRSADLTQATKPCFLYRFDHGGVRYFYTNFDQDVTLIGGPASRMSDPQMFVAAQIEHDRPEQTIEAAPKQVAVSLAAVDEALRIHFISSPLAQIDVEVYRVNSAALPGPVDYAAD